MGKIIKDYLYGMLLWGRGNKREQYLAKRGWATSRRGIISGKS